MSTEQYFSNINTQNVQTISRVGNRDGHVLQLLQVKYDVMHSVEIELSTTIFNCHQ
jgi:hypothetical protein